MIEKVNIKHLLYVGIACMAINLLFVGCGKSATIDQLQSDTDRNLGRIKAESAIVGVGVERSQTAGINAQQAIAGVREKINGSRETFNDFRAGISELERKLGECQRLAEQNSNLIDGIDGAN